MINLTIEDRDGTRRPVEIPEDIVPVIGIMAASTYPLFAMCPVAVGGRSTDQLETTEFPINV